MTINKIDVTTLNPQIYNTPTRIGTTNSTEPKTLIQRGRATSVSVSAGLAGFNTSVTFPVPFTGVPSVAFGVEYSTGSIDDVTVGIVALSATAVTFRVFARVHGSTSQPIIPWIAAGPI